MGNTQGEQRVVSKFIVVEGLIGVGKTSLVRLLEKEWGAKLILEPAETNPFLESFYEDPKEYAFPVQIFYLISRWRQQNEIWQGDLFTEWVVSDYLFAKDRLFAEKTLNKDELTMYDRFASTLDARSPVPDLVVYLEAPLETILTRIAGRNAPGEGAITQEYLVDLKERYEVLLDGWSVCPLLRISNRELNYVDNEFAQQEVLNKITDALRQPAKGVPPGSVVDREGQLGLFL